MRSLFKSKQQVTNLAWLGVDIHSHLLPAIDDGVSSPAQTIEFCKRLNDLGLTTLFTTPHIFTELYPNTQATIENALATVKQEQNRLSINFKLGAAAEYMIDESFIVSDDLITLPGRHILIEMSYLAESPHIEETIFQLQLKGYKVILAHPERYNFYHSNKTRFDRFKDMGVLFQLNLLSVLGYYGAAVEKTAQYLVKKGYYDLAGSDIHHEKHLSTLEKAVQSGAFFHLIGQYPFQNKELFL